MKRISRTDKTSLAIDRSKVERAKAILETTTIAATVDAALDEVIRLGARRRLADRILRNGGIGPDPAELRELRRPTG